MVLKLPSVHPVSRATAVAQGIYAREVHFYTVLAPTLKIRTPHCWYADLAENAGKSRGTQEIGAAVRERLESLTRP